MTNETEWESQNSDCEFCGLPSMLLSEVAEMTVCQNCTELAELMYEIISEEGW